MPEKIILSIIYRGLKQRFPRLTMKVCF